MKCPFEFGGKRLANLPVSNAMMKTQSQTQIQSKNLPFFIQNKTRLINLKKRRHFYFAGPDRLAQYRGLSTVKDSTESTEPLSEPEPHPS